MYPQTQEIIAKKIPTIFPGCVYRFIQKEQQDTICLGNAAIVPEKEPMTVNHLFDVASLTKVVCTTSVVLQLWEKGQLNLDAPLQNYLPTFQNNQITLRHLLTHTSDIQTWIANRDQLNAQELRAAYFTLQSGEYLGKKVKYTDAGTILLGFMLEEIFQKSLTTIFREAVLQPLQMTNSYFPLIANQLIVPTEQLADGTVLRGETHDPKARTLGEHAGNAGLFTSIDDLTKFVRAYFQEEILQKTTIEMLLQDQTPLKNGHRSLGWDLREHMLFHTGYTGTFLLIDPKKQDAFIFLSNRVHPTDNREVYIQHRDEILAAYFAEKE
ncbi:serine hydrolase domain-containing protein [Candidatus Enterococcus willemsii]|uniref:Serine hydrolase n=1 Tax=Candidatus Enterococcus willemsii TaxID=1857215 RepID=A0ABQ6Z0P3_9ENTE|nr:serine hydrolase domain-containing protein [Enterococcus sp. CU12B]KAF1304576.1 serine hydrolase [Enterococcus sp. CU12B]